MAETPRHLNLQITPSSIAQMKAKLAEEMTALREEGFREGQRSGVDKVLSMLQKRALDMTIQGDSPEYQETIRLVRDVAKLKDTLN